MRFAPTLAHIYIFIPHFVRANRIRPNQHSPNIFSDNIKDKFENSVAYTPKDLGFSPAKTRSFGYKNPVFQGKRTTIKPLKVMNQGTHYPNQPFFF